MFLTGFSANQAESPAIGRTVRHAEIRRAIRDLPFRRSQRARATAVRLEFPAHNFRPRKPAAQGRDDLRGRGPVRRAGCRRAWKSSSGRGETL